MEGHTPADLIYHFLDLVSDTFEVVRRIIPDLLSEVGGTHERIATLHDLTIPDHLETNEPIDSVLVPSVSRLD